MRTIERIKASNILSFDPDGLDLELRDLNVLIGANRSGKSNFLELFSLLRALPRGEEDSNNINSIIRKSGGIQQWLWRGHSNNGGTISAQYKIYLEQFLGVATQTIKHYFVINDFNNELWLNYESFDLQKEDGDAFPIELDEDRNRKNYNRSLSILSQLNQVKNNSYVCLETIAIYEKIRLYGQWQFGRNSIFRRPQPADQRNDRLEEDFSNLGLFLNKISKTPSAKRALIKAFNDLYEGLDGYEVIIEGNSVQVFFTEGEFTIPATRLSDGSLRYLCLLAILLDPTPPPIICLEEPELGLHPDLIPKIADLLIDASTRTQLIVTTHSDILIDALSEQPESVLVCEKHDGATQITRLKKAEVEPFLEKYRLGQLWSMGDLGGNRW